MGEFSKKYDDYECNDRIESRDVCLCLPVTVTPDVNVGTAVVRRIGNPELSDYCCGGSENTCCSFAISQKLRVDIPVDFGVKVETGNTFIDCDCDCNDNL